MTLHSMDHSRKLDDVIPKLYIEWDWWLEGEISFWDGPFLGVFNMGFLLSWFSAAGCLAALLLQPRVECVGFGTAATVVAWETSKGGAEDEFEGLNVPCCLGEGFVTWRFTKTCAMESDTSFIRSCWWDLKWSILNRLGHTVYTKMVRRNRQERFARILVTLDCWIRVVYARYVYIYTLSLSLSISIYIYLYLSISIYIYLYLSISIYLYLSLSLSIYLSTYLPIYLAI